MSGRLTKRLRNEPDTGFTLIELLIVIVILGILAAIVVFAIGATRGDAVANSCKTDFKSIELASEAYYTKSGSYPLQADFSVAGKTLLKTYPSSSDYSFTYLAGVITVKDKAGATKGTASSACDSL
jgi:general secretion pathway protein G